MKYLFGFNQVKEAPCILLCCQFTAQAVSSFVQVLTTEEPSQKVTFEENLILARHVGREGGDREGHAEVTEVRGQKEGGQAEPEESRRQGD